MLRLTRSTTLSALAALAALALAVPAQANQVKGTCQIDGELKMQDKVNHAFGMRLMGGKGTYTFFDLNARCAGTIKGQPMASFLTLISTGTFATFTCGTAKFQSDSLTVLGASDGQASKYNAILSDEKYAMEFEGSAGTFWWHSSDKDTPEVKTNLHDLDPDKDGVLNEKDYDAGGGVALVDHPTKPTTINNPPGNCTKAFQLTGAIDFHDS